MLAAVIGDALHQRLLQGTMGEARDGKPVIVFTRDRALLASVRYKASVGFLHSQGWQVERAS